LQGRDDERNEAMKDTIDMAREAGIDPTYTPGMIPMFKAFEALVRADEREACANKTGEFARKWWAIHCDSNKHMETTRKAHNDFCALQAAIRARGEAK
jgi:hypothetical protein